MDMFKDPAPVERRHGRGEWIAPFASRIIERVVVVIFIFALGLGIDYVLAGMGLF